jgi:hypothetical protein
MYAVKRPRLILTLALVNVAAALLAALIGAQVLRQSGPVPHELCRAPIHSVVTDVMPGSAARLAVAHQSAPMWSACVVPILPAPVPTPNSILTTTRAMPSASQDKR